MVRSILEKLSARLRPATGRDYYSAYTRRQENHLWDWNEVPNARLHELIHEEVGGYLTPLGFEAVADGRWVRGVDAPIRQVFSMRREGRRTNARPRWGVSLDFVPHFSGAGIRWHRSNKSAQLDLWATSQDREMYVDCAFGEAPIRRDYRWVTTETVVEAQKFWATCPTVGELPRAVEYFIADHAKYGKRFTTDQNPLALAMIFAKSGRLAEAQDHIAQMLAYYNDPIATQERIKRLLNEAAQDPFPPPPPEPFWRRLSWDGGERTRLRRWQATVRM
jgi:hypothetical protein